MSQQHMEYIGKLLVARTGQGDLHCVGKCLAYADHPTVLIETPSGERIHWAAHLCKVVDIGDDATHSITSGWRPTGAEGSK